MKKAVFLQRLAAPLTLAQLAFAVNTFVTNYFLSRHSAAALQAALPGSMLAVAVSSLAVSTLAYSGTIFAERHGAGDTAGARAVFHAALAAAVATAPLFVLAGPLGHIVLGLFDTAPDVLRAQKDYYDILLTNGFLTMSAAVLAGFFTGQGKTRFVGTVSVLGFLLNMALAPVFIGGTSVLPVHGIKGAGWAATVSNLVPCIILAAAVARSRTAQAVRRFRPDDFREILRLGFPNGVKSLLDIGGFFVFTAILSECSPAAVAASTAAFAINGIFQAFPLGLSQALEIATARQSPALRHAFLLPCAGLLAAYSGVFSIILYLAGPSILISFARGGEGGFISEFTSTAGPLVWILAWKAFFESTTMSLQAYLRGWGKTSAVFRIQFITSGIFWIPLYFTVRAFAPGIPAYWLTMLAAAILSTAVLACQAKLLSHTRK